MDRCSFSVRSEWFYQKIPKQSLERVKRKNTSRLDIECAFIDGQKGYVFFVPRRFWATATALSLSNPANVTKRSGIVDTNDSMAKRARRRIPEVIRVPRHHLPVSKVQQSH